MGTIADCFQAGVPQLIRPMFGDQPDNARRVVKLGVGDWIAGSKFRLTGVTSKLNELIRSPVVAAQCQEIQGRMRAEDGLEIATNFIEQFSDRIFSARRRAIE